MKKISILFLVFVLIAVILSGRDRTDIDMDGASKDAVPIQLHEEIEIQTFDTAKQPRSIYLTSIPSRVFVSEGSILESLLALGQSDKIVAASISGASNGAYDRLRQAYSDEIGNIPHIAPHGMNREQVVAYAPDFMVGWQSAFALARFGTVSWWQARGVNTYIAATSNRVLEHGTIEDECRFLDDLGRIFAVKDQTDKMIRTIYAELVMDEALIAGRKSQDVMVIEINGRVITNYDDRWLVGDMVKRLGGKMPVAGRRIGDETLFAYDPDVIFVVYFNPQHGKHAEEFLGDVRFNSLKALHNKRIYMLPFWYMYTPAVHTIDGIRAIKRGLYPEL